MNDTKTPYEKLTKEQKAFYDGYDEGYTQALLKAADKCEFTWRHLSGLEIAKKLRQMAEEGR